MGAGGPSGGSVAGRTPASRLDLATGTDSAVALARGYCLSPSGARAREIITERSEWDIVDIARILCKEVAVGMTAPQVRLSRGFPGEMNQTNIFGPTNGRWWYGDQGVAFEDGVVIELLTDDTSSPAPADAGASKPADSTDTQLTRAVALCHHAARQKVKPRWAVNFIDDPIDLGKGESHVQVELHARNLIGVPTLTAVDCKTRETAARLELTYFDSWEAEPPDP